ncbi:hypothetical protein LOD99_502 [Oopsacas minuta]|uniref:Branched-chain-amino-acid aminotransferase n=1 Tax=Oopsacas minuta TaxID=111878 RepID=A0AAV7KAX7_9METZ|nr:hypothetical protein LOD99_502 [Oopsacas minuta]
MTSLTSSFLPALRSRFKVFLSPHLLRTVREISFSGQEVTTEYTTKPKPRPAPDNPLTFGTVTTDHMFITNWKLGQGWKNPRIVPYQPLQLDPTAKVLHYAIEVFEGMKAYLGDDKELRMFRPMKNMDRLHKSAIRATLPVFDKTELKECLKALLEVDRDWAPDRKECSLYIRPTIIGVDASLGVNVATEALLYTILCPVGSYYGGGSFEAVSLYADEKAVRAWPGGAGSSKLGANYAPTVARQVEAAENGCVQVLWLFGDDHELTEVGTMNIFAFWENQRGEREVITPPLSDIILPGVTRDSVIQLIRSWGDVPVVERTFTMQDVMTAVNENRMLGLFGTGTACVVSPVKDILYRGERIAIPTLERAPVVTKVYKNLTDIHYGRTRAFSEWVELV